MWMAQDQVYALLADGTTVEIRPAGPGDFGAVEAMHKAMSPDNTYMRFFNISRLVGRDRGPADLQGAGARPGGAARAGRRRGGRRGQLRHGRDRESRGRLRGGRPHAPQGHRHPAARASGLLRQEPPDHHLHRGDPDGEQGHAERVRRSRTACRTPLRGRGLQADVPAAQRGRRPHARQLPERRGRKGAPRRGRQPAVRVRARVGRGDRREPAPGDGGPGDPGQHPGQRVRRPPLHGEPAGPADRRRAVPVLGARPARGRSTWR